MNSIIIFGTLLGCVFAQQMENKPQMQQGINKEVNSGEPAAAESNSYGRYRSGGYGGGGGSGGGYGGGHVDPRYFDRGDTPHFGLAGFPFGYERRYYGQNVVYDNSLAGFPLNYYNYQQDYGNNYNSYKPQSYSKPQYRSAAYTLPKSYGSSYEPEYGAYLGSSKQGSGSGAGGQYYSLQYGYKK